MDTNLIVKLFDLSSTGYFYTYSALAQSMAALLGVLGIFGVYRLQLLQQQIPKVINRSRDLCREIGMPVDHITDANLLETMRHPPSAYAFGHVARLNELADELERAISKKEAIKTSFFWLILFFAVVTAAALFLTGQGEYLSSHDTYGSWVTFAILCVAAILLVRMSWFAYDCLAEKPLSATFREWWRSVEVGPHV